MAYYRYLALTASGLAKAVWQAVLLAFWLQSSTIFAEAFGAGDEVAGLLTVPGTTKEDLSNFLRKQMPLRDAVAVAFLVQGSKRHKLMGEIASDSSLSELLVLSVQYKNASKASSSLEMHRDGEAVITYDGKWTSTAIKRWLAREAYTLVAAMQAEFRVRKYMQENPFGLVLVSQALRPQKDPAINRALLPFARQYHDKLKFTFFSNASSGLSDYSRRYGVWTSDELLIIEEPRQQFNRLHRNDPGPPKYRLVGLTAERIEAFFRDYAAGNLTQYYKAATASPGKPVFRKGIRELTAWDFPEVVNDPRSSVLVLFVSANCSACSEFGDTFEKLAQYAKDEVKRHPKSPFKRLTLARIDQTANEHSELVEGTPCLRYWPPGKKKRPQEIVVRGDLQRYIDKLDEHLSEEDSEGAGDDDVCSSSQGNC